MAPAHNGKGLFLFPSGGGAKIRTKRRKIAAKKHRIPVITMGCQVSSFMNKPLVLHNVAVARIDNCPAILCSFGTIGFIL